MIKSEIDVDSSITETRPNKGNIIVMFQKNIYFVMSTGYKMLKNIHGGFEISNMMLICLMNVQGFGLLADSYC